MAVRIHEVRRFPHPGEQQDVRDPGHAPDRDQNREHLPRRQGLGQPSHGDHGQERQGPDKRHVLLTLAPVAVQDPARYQVADPGEPQRRIHVAQGPVHHHGAEEDQDQDRIGDAREEQGQERCRDPDQPGADLQHHEVGLAAGHPVCEVGTDKLHDQQDHGQSGQQSELKLGGAQLAAEIRHYGATDAGVVHHGQATGHGDDAHGLFQRRTVVGC